MVIKERAADVPQIISPSLAEGLDGVVREYMDMVYAAALRQVRDPHLAADVTQAVFLILQRKFSRFGPGAIVSAWLLRTTRYACLEALRRERRRMRHEGKAAIMREERQPKVETDAECAAMIDEVLDGLGPTDRAAIVLAYFEGRSHAEVGTRLGISTEAVHKRVQRALGKMRRMLLRRGVSLPTAGVAAALAVMGKPAAAPAAVTQAVAGSMGGHSPAVVQVLAKGTMMQLVKVKVGMVAAAALVGVSMAGFVAHEMARRQSVPVAAPVANETAMEQLAARYKLEVGENLRRIQELPEPAREEMVALTTSGQYLNSDGSLNPMYHNASFRYKDGQLSRMGVGFAAGLAETVKFLPINWYEVGHLDRINYWNANPSKIVYGSRMFDVQFNAPPADWVVRDGAATGDVLADLAKIVSADTKRPFTFKHSVMRRPCIALTGKIHAAPKNTAGFDVVAVTMDPAPQEKVKSWLAADNTPRDAFTNYALQEVAEKVDAPFFSSVMVLANYDFVVTKDAVLHHEDADFKEKLGRVLKNLEAQIGGTWTIEDRDIDVYQPVETKEGAATGPAPGAVP